MTEEIKTIAARDVFNGRLGIVMSHLTPIWPISVMDVEICPDHPTGWHAIIHAYNGDFRFLYNYADDTYTMTQIS